MKPSIDALTGVRAVAALWVLLFHLRSVVYPMFPSVQWVDPLARVGYLGVDLFFTLSGFILSYNYLDRFTSLRAGAAINFIKLRFARVWPVHFLTLNLALLSWAAAGLFGVSLGDGAQKLYSVEAWFRNLFMVHAWFGVENTFNGASWSISSEWFAYLLFPLAGVLLARLRPASTAGRIACLAAGLAAGAGYYAILAGGSIADNPLLRISFEFLGGCLLYIVYASGGRMSGWGAPGGFVAVGGAVAAAFLAGGAARPGLLMLPFISLGVFSLSFGRGHLARLLATPVMKFWGEASYSVYMLHGVTLQAMGRLLPGTRFAEAGVAERLGVVALYLALLLAPPALTYLWVERPARSYIRGLKLPGETVVR